MKAVMYGAGNIGRGFIGQLFSASGYDVSFVDVAEPVVDALNRNGRYPVRVLLQEGHREEWVERVSAVNGRDEAAVAETIANADLMATAVGVNVLKFIVRPIALGLQKRFEANRKPLNIIICENLIGADELLRELIMAELPDGEIRAWFTDQVGLCEASIGRMVPIQTPEMQGDNPLRVCVEAYNELPVDRDAFKGELPALQNLKPFSPFSFYIERKLYIHNMGHALCAYLGDTYGDEFIWQAMQRPLVELTVLRAMTQSAMALAQRYSVDCRTLLQHVDDLLMRFKNRQLGDTCFRVGRDLRRKLAANDRLAGAIDSCKKAGVDNRYICLAYAFALRFSQDDLLKELSPEAVMTDISGLDLSSEEAKLIAGLNGLSLEQAYQKISQ